MGRRRLILKGIKQCSTKEEEEEDLISALPDDILRSILSLLPIKSDVKTSILSSRWRYLWAYRSNLDFDVHNMVVGTSILERGLQDEEGLQVLNSAFVSRVSKFLHLYRGPKISSLAVSYCFNLESSSHLDRWIGLAIAMGVECLQIILSYLRRSPNFKFYSFPCLLLEEKTSCLKHLQLKLCLLECPPNFNGFNTLISVDLLEVKLNESSLEIFFSSCMLLQVFTMRRCILPNYLKATGPSGNLKCLQLVQCFSVQKILVFAPKLTSFTYSGSMVDILLYKVPSLERLFINFDGGYRSLMLIGPQDSVISKLPVDIPHLQSLSLQLINEMTVLPAKIASYVNLKELELEAFSSASVDFLWIGSTIDALPLLLKLHVMLAPNSHRKRGEARRMRTSGLPHNQLKQVLITGLRVSVCTFTSAYEALFYLEQPCTRHKDVYYFDTLDSVLVETTISQRGETARVSALKARALIMDTEFSDDPDMRRVLDAGGLQELMVVLLSPEESLALQMTAAPTKLHIDPPPRELSIFRFGFNEEPQQLLAPVVHTILRAFMNELVSWLRNHAPPRPPIED